MAELFSTSIEGEAFPHRQLWRCATFLYQIARSNSKGAKYPDMGACLMAFLAYEAYLNLLISRRDPDVWQNERTFFGQSPFRGIEGKLEWLSTHCGQFKIDKGARPYQTVHRLGELRDRLSHAKPYTYSETKVHTEHTEPDWWPRSAFHDITAEFATLVIQDVDEFMEYINEHAKVFIKDSWLQAGALRGPTGYSSSTTRTAT